MSVQLLDKTRKINKLLHNNNSHKVVFNDICEVLSEILVSNILVISKKGKVLGVKNRDDIVVINELIQDEVGGHIDLQSISLENVLVLCLCINRMRNMKLMILF